ncbi:PilW family protein [Cupriavidus sp. 2SB]|uniref:PilW family protein n=1 Tax=unclassified Cupriavidus TaxID=2640874 RepID=UPI0010F82322|nr:PilW family protein [Cupriavidus sp. 2SB]
MARPAQPLSRLGRARGFTLIELMVTLVISLLVLMAATAFYIMSRSSYVAIDDSAALEERGAFALSVMTRLMRQTGYVPVSDNKSGGMMPVYDDNLRGIDACSNPNDSETMACGPGGSLNASDAVMIRYYGLSKSKDDPSPDESVVDCSGQGVAGASNSDTASADRGLSILYIGNGADGKPALMCKYRERDGSGTESKTTFVTQELVSGVETMQLLYGVSTNDDDVPDKYATASAMALTDWVNVKTVKIALVVRADNASADAQAPAAISLFGPLYTGDNASYTPTTDTKSVRKLYSATVQVRNYQTCGESTCM